MNILKRSLIRVLPWANGYRQFAKTRQHGSYSEFLRFKIFLNDTYWPKKKTCLLANKKNIYIGVNSLIGRPGSYIQGKAGVYIGDYVQFGPNVGVLSSNHDLYDQRVSRNEKVVIGDYCWLGMNSIVLPGVKLGTRTIVAAGSVVTKSFPEGYCVIGGSPAKVIKYLDREKFVPWKDKEEFYGFSPKEIFEVKNVDIVKKLREEINLIGK